MCTESCQILGPAGLASGAGLPPDLCRSTGSRNDFQDSHLLDARQLGVSSPQGFLGTVPSLA